MFEELDQVELVKIGMFAFAALIGMLYAYVDKWANSDSKATLLSYLFGNPKAVVKALTTLVVLCVAAGGMSYLDTLSGFNIFIAGAGIGFLVPRTIEEKAKTSMSVGVK